MHKITIVILLISAICLTSCKEIGLCRDTEFTMQRTNHAKDDLRIDGYYFRDLSDEGTKERAEIYYLYSNGVLLGGWSVDYALAEEGNIEVDIDNEFQKKTKWRWGIFNVKDDHIQIERWKPNQSGCVTTIFEQGELLNDTTFVITQRDHISRKRTYRSEYPTHTYYFRALSAKPDSTNRFIQ
jgi:hypothetical protein